MCTKRQTRQRLSRIIARQYSFVVEEKEITKMYINKALRLIDKTFKVNVKKKMSYILNEVFIDKKRISQDTRYKEYQLGTFRLHLIQY